ncbi:MAG: sugar transferase [Anaerovibrio sp.]|uniref:sugar transferase n=1 Tax=Anaerovibrio sp. TaxID=1872532 RepID=UPI0025EA4606|nr:sugar transferase [Anaerovibrio sp.]MCR5176918.1 sugar transferase [Anaerovibrio sp.]
MHSSDNISATTIRHFSNILVFIVLDYIAVVLAQYISRIICGFLGKDLVTSMVFSSEYQYIFIPAIILLCIALKEGYLFNRPSLDMGRDIFKGLVFGIIMCGIILFAMRELTAISRTYTGVLSVMIVLSVAVIRYGASKIIDANGWFREDILLIGAGKTAERITKYLKSDICYRYNIIGLIDDHPLSKELVEDYPLLGKLDQSVDIIQDHDVNTVVVAIPGMETDRMNDLLATIRPYVKNIFFVPDLVGTPMGRVHIQTFFSQQVAIIKSYNDMSRMWNKFVKRTFDLAMVLLFMPIIVPVLAILALIIKLDSPGPAFFNAERMGQNGKNFICYKFRSMYVDGDARLEQYLEENPQADKEWRKYAKLRYYDPRVTKCGRWMRRFSLDELPQLINVFIGNMSLVGPRPYLPREKEQIGESLDTIVLCKPGITGFWQINGRSDVSFEGRVAMDVWYVNNWSLARDFMFLLKTFKVIFSKDSGAY